MKPAPFDYHRPESVPALLDLLGRLEDIRLLAGGQSLMPMMNFRFVQPANLIDLNRIEALGEIRIGEQEVVFGPMVRQRAIQRDAALGRIMPVLGLALSHVGHRQTRARGTIGGSLCHFDPSAELCNMAALHDARLTISGKGGEREVSFPEFGLGYLTTAIMPDEFLSQIRFQRWPEGHGYGFQEFAVRHGDFALSAVSCLLVLNGDGSVARIAVAASGASTAPARLLEAEAAAIGKPADDALCRDFAIAASQVEAMTDAYFTADYRQHLARIMTFRAVRAAIDSAQARRLT